MLSFLESNTFQTLSQIVIGSVWVFHGLYSKILDGIPRHRLIVGRVLGNRFAGVATKAIGVLEVLLGLWVFTGWERFGCAVVQTLAITGMNTLEIFFAGDLLIGRRRYFKMDIGVPAENVPRGQATQVPLYCTGSLAPSRARSKTGACPSNIPPSPQPSP